MDFGITSVAAITVICYLIGLIVKASGLDNKYIPAIVGPVRRISWHFEPLLCNGQLCCKYRGVTLCQTS